ncbi:hypothetical protein CPC08DRAFT_769526 [Agrocybe pediades]|nr:hypothetical protein CPC08DRAFT_769526 [Agrocybe pediades]
MSLSDELPFSVTEQKALISSSLNSALVFQFLMGIYLGVFPATIYLYATEKYGTTSYSRIIVGSVIALFMFTTTSFALTWHYTNVLFSKQGDTESSILIGTIFGVLPALVTIVEDIALFGGLLLADGLMVWRCFHACGRSLKAFALPMVLLLVETALGVTTIVYDSLVAMKPGYHSDKTDAIANRLAGAVFTSVAMTSLAATFVICSNIYRHTASFSASRKRYRHVTDILIQSSAIYTLVIVFQAILGFLDTVQDGRSWNAMTVVFILVNYVSDLTVIVSVRAIYLSKLWLQRI